MRRHTTQIEGKICAVLAGSMHFLGQWVRLHMAITLLDVLDHIAQHHRCEFVPEAQREEVNGIAIEHIRWRLQSSKHVSESAGGWFFSIGPSVLIGLFFFKGWKLPPPACPGTTGNISVGLARFVPANGQHWLLCLCIAAMYPVCTVYLLWIQIFTVVHFGLVEYFETELWLSNCILFACTRLPALGISWTCHLDGFVSWGQASGNSDDLPHRGQIFNSELGAEIRMRKGK